MFDVGWSELVVIGAVALIVIGPKDLPKALRAVGKMTAKVRGMAAEFQGQFQDAMREAEFDALKKEVEGINKAAQDATRVDFNPVDTLREEMKAAVEGRPPADPYAPQPPVGTGPEPDLTPVIAPPALPEPSAAPVIVDHPTPAPVVAEEAQPKPKRTRKAKNDAPDAGGAA